MRIPLLSLTFALAFSAPAFAQHCTTWTTSVNDADTIIVDLGPDAVEFRYLVKDLCTVDAPVGDCTFGTWLYAEVNGIDGLQRGDYIVDDSCHGIVRPDSFIE